MRKKRPPSPSVYIGLGVFALVPIVDGVEGLRDHTIMGGGKTQVRLYGSDSDVYSWGSIVFGCTVVVLAIAGLISRLKGGSG